MALIKNGAIAKTTLDKRPAEQHGTIRFPPSSGGVLAF
jgi:hypothetical protein